MPKVWRHDYDEREVLLDYKQYLPQVTPEYEFPKDLLKILADMQHYGMPTRLLDWSTSPLVALYFACTSEEKESIKEDGMVYVFNPWKYYGEIPKSIRKKYSSIHDIYVHARAMLAFYQSRGKYNLDEIKYLIKKQYHYDLQDGDIEKPYPYISSICNDRIVHQKGAFTVHGTNEKTFDSPKSDPKHWYLITIKNKHEILKELDSVGIDDYFIFPDFEGMKNTFRRKKGLFRTLSK